MSLRASTRLRLPALRRERVRAATGRGDRVLLGLCSLAGLLAAGVLAEVVYQVIDGAGPAISHFGLGFLVHSAWAPSFGIFGAAAAIFGTAVSSFMALVIAAPLGIAIGLYLAMMAPPPVRAVVGPLVEMLAAIPSVIVGFWGVDVVAPFAAHHLEPLLHSALGFVPVFGPPQSTGLSVFGAGLVLTLMILPIVASLSRDLFLTVPVELKDGAAALGATRWEIIRGIVLPTTASGVAAAVVLGLGRALGEAIAVLQVIGDGAGINTSLFLPGISLASRVANEFQTPDNRLDIPSLFYLALILLVIGLATSLLARAIAGRFDVSRTLAR
ncbi:MAG TPA: phosphate ABC transporter permease subunit PstC [Solirubrobacteraceae bacterium]|nr:phosphate ABC transporter permease subunit PstC [Solirubrobacteraceae bacterium]